MENRVKQLEKREDLLLKSEDFTKKYNRNKVIAEYTLGCKTNQYETDAIMNLFYKEDYKSVAFDELADIYLVNTCTVTSVGNKKSRQMIRRAKKNNPNAIVIVMGCYAQVSTEEVAALEEVDIIIGTNARSQMLYYLERYIMLDLKSPVIHVDDIMKVTEFEDLTLGTELKNTRAFIKIQEGCNQFCSYCIIPYARGRVRSRDFNNILTEIQHLTESGYAEFVLTGIHIGSYGIDINHTLIELLESINEIEGVKRIRLGSIEPRLIDETFCNRLKPLKKVCDHFHLSLQSGSDTVLKRMNRKYTTEDFENAVKRLRTIYDSPAITTDIIVGFPGESEAEFMETLKFVETIKFSEIHVFPYSIREGTKAATMKDQIPMPVKKSRSEVLIQKAGELNEQYMRTFIGKVQEIVVEEIDGNIAVGHSTNYLKVSWPLEGHERLGSFCKVTLITLENGQLVGISL